MIVLILTNSLGEQNGWSVVSNNLNKNLKKFNATFYCYDHNKIFPKRFRLTTLDILIPLINLVDLFIIFTNLKKKPDIIHCGVETFAVLAWFLSILYKKPFTITAHGTYSCFLPKFSWFYKKAFHNANKIFAVSNFTKYKIINSNIKCNVKVINLGVNKKVFKPNHQTSKENNILFVGNNKRRKGLIYLLKACLEVPPFLINELFLVGNISLKDPLLVNLINEIRTNGTKIRILNNLSTKELVEIYQKVKVNILPSQNFAEYFEGFGLIHLEANACGTLSIGCLNSGNEDAIKEGFGFLIPQKNHKALSQKINEIFNLKSYPKLKIKDIRSWKDFAKEYEKEWVSIKKDYS